MNHESTTHHADRGADRVWRGAGPTGLPPWAGAAAHDRLAPKMASDGASGGASERVEARGSTIAARHGRADFVEKYETALLAIRDGLWPIPTEAWVAHMAVVAGYFDQALQAQVREGLLRAIRWRRHCLAATIQPPARSQKDEEI